MDRRLGYFLVVVMVLLAILVFWNLHLKSVIRSYELRAIEDSLRAANYERDMVYYQNLKDEMTADLEQLQVERDSIAAIRLGVAKLKETNKKKYDQELYYFRALPITERLRYIATHLPIPDSIQ
jgi:hypothetical protein